MYRSEFTTLFFFVTSPPLGMSRLFRLPSPPSLSCCTCCIILVVGLASAQERHGVKVDDKSWLVFTPGTVQSMNAACAMLPEDASVMVMTPRWAGVALVRARYMLRVDPKRLLLHCCRDSP